MVNFIATLGIVTMLGIIGFGSYPQTTYAENKCACAAHVGETGNVWVGSCSAQCPTDMVPTCKCETAKNSCTCEAK